MSLFSEFVEKATAPAKKATKKVQREIGKAAGKYPGGTDITRFLTQQAQGGARAFDANYKALLGLFTDDKALEAVTPSGLTPGGDDADTPETTEERIAAAGRAQRLRLFKATGRKSLIRTSGQGVRDRTTATTRARAT